MAGRSFPLDGRIWKDEKGRYPDLARATFWAVVFVTALLVLVWLVFVVWR